MFVLCSDVTIGNFRFSGVHEVVIRRSIHSIVETAVIRLPSIAKIVKKGVADPDTIITGKQFSDGDPVSIKLGYNGDLQTEFMGFVKRRNLNMPLEIECEGYSWLLRRNTIKKFKKSTTVKELLGLAVSNLEGGKQIKVSCDVDISLGNVQINNSTGFDLINDIRKYTDAAISCFFIEPDTLWCGLIYTPYANGNDKLGAGSVKYRLGYNVVKDNSLRERLPNNDPVQVRYNKRQANGDRLSQNSDAFRSFSRTHSRILNQIKEAPALKQLANEKAYKLNYSGYEGTISAFLQPYASPGYVATIIDNRYEERNGRYLVEGIEIIFGVNGARRIVEIGPKVGFGK